MLITLLKEIPPYSHEVFQSFTCDNHYFASIACNSKAPCMITFSRVLVALLPRWIFWIVDHYSVRNILITPVLLLNY